MKINLIFIAALISSISASYSVDMTPETQTLIDQVDRSAQSISLNYSIPDWMLQGMGTLEELTISGQDAYAIGRGTFQNCHSLKTVRLDGPSIIYNDAFGNCNNLQSLILSNAVSYIHDSAFNGATLKSVTIHLKEGEKNNSQRVKSIKKALKNRCNQETRIDVISAKSSTFERFDGCMSMEDIKRHDNYFSANNISIPGRIGYICDNAWTNSNVNDVIIENGISYIGNNAFSNICNLHSVKITDSVKFIGNNAFANTDQLNKISIKDGVKYIGEFAFALLNNNNGINIDELVIPGSVDIIDNNAFMNRGIIAIKIKHGVKIIGDNAFAGCKNLTTIEIPSSVKYIGKGAFRMCNNATITLRRGEYTDIIRQSLINNGIREHQINMM